LISRCIFRLRVRGHLPALQPGAKPDTWWSYRFNARQKNIGWRIDYFCVDAKSAQRVKNAAILSEIMGSDHCPVQLDFV